MLAATHKTFSGGDEVSTTGNTGCVAWDSFYGYSYWLDVAAA